MASPELILAGITATMQAVQTWFQVRDSTRTAKVFDEQSQAITPEIEAAAKTLGLLIPPDVLDDLQRRLDHCWVKYRKVIGNDKDYLPDDVNNATDAVIKCVCREIARIRKLNGNAIPPGPMEDYWDKYNCAST